MLLVLSASTSVLAQGTTIDSIPQKNVGVLHPGDILLVRVYQHEEFSGDFIIDSRGVVQIPGVGSIPAGGMTPASMHARLVEALETIGIRDPSLSVIPQIRLGTLGEVHQQGAIVTDPGITLLALLSVAGGPTDRADLEKAYVIRDNQPFKVDLERALAGTATGGITLFSNDVLVVPRKTGLTRENLSFWMGTASLLLALANVLIASR